MSLSRLEQFTLAAMQVLMTQQVAGRPMNTHVIAEKALKQAQDQIAALDALERVNQSAPVRAI